MSKCFNNIRCPGSNWDETFFTNGKVILIVSSNLPTEPANFFPYLPSIVRNLMIASALGFGVYASYLSVCFRMQTSHLVNVRKKLVTVKHWRVWHPFTMRLMFA